MLLEMLEQLEARPSLAGVPGMREADVADLPAAPWRRALISLVTRVRPDDAEGRALAAKISSGLAELAQEDTRGAALQGRIRALDDGVYEARQRLGHAVQEIGVELSAARVALRTTQAQIEEATADDTAAEAELHKTERRMAMHWPSRFDGPSRELADLVEQVASALRAWCDARERRDAARAELGPCTSRVEDLEFQLTELRGRLREVEVKATLEQAEPGTSLAMVQARARAIEERLREQGLALQQHVSR